MIFPSRQSAAMWGSAGSTNLQRELRLPALKFAACDGTTSTLAQASELDDLLCLTRGSQTIVIQILNIQRPPLFDTELSQIR